MAAITRRIFGEIATEHIKRVGQTGNSAYSTRANYFITAAYYDLSHLYHHHELDAIDTSKVFSTTEGFITLPTDCDVVIAVIVRAVTTGVFVRALEESRTDSVLAKYHETTSGVPTQYARHGSKIYFDRLPAVANPLSIYYYKLPTTPDFDAGTVASPRISDLKWLWDEHILEYSVARAQGAVWAPQHVPTGSQLLSEYLSNCPEQLLGRYPIVSHSGKQGEGRPVGGPLG